MRTLLLLVGTAVSVLASGCGGAKSGTEKDSRQKELLVFCGAGLRPPVAELAEMFAKENRVAVSCDYAGAEVLIAKAKLSKRGDIYVPGDKAYVDLAATKGLILSQKPVCYFVPTILLQKDNPEGIRGVSDLTRPGIRLGLGNPRYIPIGRKSREILEKSAVAWADIEANVKFLSATVNELCIQVQAGSLDAVIVWDAVAHRYAEYADEVEIPCDQNVISTVDAAVLSFTANRELAQKFIDFASSERGRTIFRKHDYRVDAPR